MPEFSPLTACGNDNQCVFIYLLLLTVFLRFFVELLLAAFRAEIICFLLICARGRSLFFINSHFTHRVLRHLLHLLSLENSLEQKAMFLLMLYGHNVCHLLFISPFPSSSTSLSPINPPTSQLSTALLKATFFLC